MWRGGLAGLGVGVLAGWLLWGHTERAPVTDESTGTSETKARLVGPDTRSGPRLSPTGSAERGQGGSGAPGRAASPAGNKRTGGGKTSETPTKPSDRSSIFRTASLGAVFEAFDEYPRLTDGEARALTERLEQARREREAAAFLDVLRMLTQSEHPLARSRWVELYADVDAAFPEGFLELAIESLEKTRAEGAVEAALLRVHHEQKPYPWAEYVLDHGTPEQWGEVLDSSNQRLPQHAVFMSLMKKDLATARVFLHRAQKEPWAKIYGSNLLQAFLTSHRQAGLDLLDRGFRALEGGADEWMSVNDTGTLVAAVIDYSRAEDWPRVAERLNTLHSRRDRLIAYWRLNSKRRYDLSLVRPLTDRLGPDLREVVSTPGVVDNPGERIRFLARALGAVEALQTPANIAALEHAATTWTGDEAKELKDILKRIQAPASESRDGWR